MTIFYIIATVTGIFLVLLICVFVMLFKSRKKGKRLQDLFRLELNEDPVASKSAPISRWVATVLNNKISVS